MSAQLTGDKQFDQILERKYVHSRPSCAMLSPLAPLSYSPNGSKLMTSRVQSCR